MARYLQYKYRQDATNPAGALSGIEQPVAIYRHDGIIKNATKMFQSLTGINLDDIAQEKVNIFDYLSDELMEAARNVNELISFDNLSYPLRTKTPSAEEQAAYTHAAVFPITNTSKDIELNAVYFLREETEAERKDRLVYFGLFRV
jgi:hypothetical protein